MSPRRAVPERSTSRYNCTDQLQCTWTLRHWCWRHLASRWEVRPIGDRPPTECLLWLQSACSGTSTATDCNNNTTGMRLPSRLRPSRRAHARTSHARTHSYTQPHTHSIARPHRPLTRLLARSRTHSLTDPRTHTQTHTHARTNTQTHTHAGKHARTHARTHSQAHLHTNTHTYTETHTQKHTQTHTQTHKRIQGRRRAHTDAETYSRTLTCTHARTHNQTRTHAHTHTHTHTHTLTHLIAHDHTANSAVTTHPNVHRWRYVPHRTKAAELAFTRACVRIGRQGGPAQPAAAGLPGGHRRISGSPFQLRVRAAAHWNRRHQPRHKTGSPPSKGAPARPPAHPPATSRFFILFDSRLIGCHGRRGCRGPRLR